MKPENDRCEEHGMYLYRTGFGWSCKLGCYYTDDPQKIKDGFIAQYKEELKDKINKLIDENEKVTRNNERKEIIRVVYKEILELLE